MDRDRHRNTQPRIPRLLRWLVFGILLALSCQTLRPGPAPVRPPLQPTTAPAATQPSMEQKPVDPRRAWLAYAATDGNLYLASSDGSGRQAITTDGQPDETGRQYADPTWAPDGRRLAFTRVDRDAQGNITHVGVLTTSLDATGPPAVAFESDAQIPIYLAWSPNSQYLAFLASQSNHPFDLYLVENNQPARQLAEGSPFYFSWSPDSQQLLIHTGGARYLSPEARLSVLDLDGTNHELSDRPSFFQAPAWSPRNDRWLYAAEDEQGIDTLYLSQGQDRQAITAANGLPMAFSWSPDGSHLAYIIGDVGPFYGPIHLVDTQRQQDRTITPAGQVVAFFWSPDGQQIAYLSPRIVRKGPRADRGCRSTKDSELGGKLRARMFSEFSMASNDYQDCPFLPVQQDSEITIQYAWNVVRLDGRPGASLIAFEVTPEFKFLIDYFDQYAQSHTPWSRDSRALVYAIRSDAGDRIMVASLDQPDHPKVIGEGSFAVWAPR